MHDVSNDGTVVWAMIPNPDPEKLGVLANVTWLASNWTCLYGQGCPGMFPKKQDHTQPDIGCCTDGFYPQDKKEAKKISRSVKLLTPDVWDDDLRAAYEAEHTAERTKSKLTGEKARNGWETAGIPDEDGSETLKSRVINGGCIFANRSDGSSGKPGCAWLHLGNKVNGSANDIFENSEEHASFMPRVCWQVPLYVDYREEHVVIDAWSLTRWAPVEKNGRLDYHAHWWCVDGPDAYVGANMVVDSMERELRQVLEDDALYEALRDEVHRHAKAGTAGVMSAKSNHRETIDKMVGKRKLLPLVQK